MIVLPSWLHRIVGGEETWEHCVQSTPFTVRKRGTHRRDYNTVVVDLCYGYWQEWL